MDILKTATDWAKAEIFSSSFFIVFGALFVAVSIGFWQLGKTDLAKAYVIPTLVAGVLLMIIGLGLFFNNLSSHLGICRNGIRFKPPACGHLPGLEHANQAIVGLAGAHRFNRQPCIR